MKRFDPKKIRNVAIVGHNGSGKTTLVEALLYRAGTINRLGRVEDGNTVSDFDDEEKKRMMSLSLSLAPIEWKDHKINLIDTPGYSDFVQDVYQALRVADLAVFVVSAVEGVEVGTETYWKMAERMKVPRMVFINKLDKERASFDRTLDQLRDRFGSGVAPIELPIGAEESFHGVADLFRDKAYVYDSGKAQEVEIPEEMEEREHEVHDNLVEGIVVADDALLERYLSGDVPSVAELEHTMAVGVEAAVVFPVVCGSAIGPIAVDRLADFILEIAPSPADRPPIVVQAGDREVEIPRDPNGQPMGYVFKSIADPYVGQISLFKMFSGTLRNEDTIHNVTSGSDEKIKGLFSVLGKEQIQIPEVPAGDIGAVAKLSNTRTGDTLSPKSMPVQVGTAALPRPALGVALVTDTQADEDKLPTALRRLLDEDPALAVERNDETHQTILRGMGETHLNITIEKLKAKFGVSVGTEEVKVPYRETFTKPAEVEGKYKKQSGGHGQFGVAMVRFEPIDRGAGYEFVDQVKGGSIPRQFIPAVEKGIAEAMAEGGSFGFPVVDVRAVCHDGKYHSVDSSEMSFKMAGKLAFREAVKASSPALLEPISRVTVTVPAEYQGEVMGDLSSRRGQLQGTDTDGDGNMVVEAIVPTSEIMRYAIDLRSMTHGWGHYSEEPSHYDIVPHGQAERLLASNGD